jgi:hypothetical protein
MENLEEKSNADVNVFRPSRFDHGGPPGKVRMEMIQGRCGGEINWQYKAHSEQTSSGAVDLGAVPGYLTKADVDARLRTMYHTHSRGPAALEVLRGLAEAISLS